MWENKPSNWSCSWLFSLWIWAKKDKRMVNSLHEFYIGVHLFFFWGCEVQYVAWKVLRSLTVVFSLISSLYLVNAINCSFFKQSWETLVPNSCVIHDHSLGSCQSNNSFGFNIHGIYPFKKNIFMTHINENNNTSHLDK